MSKYHKKYHENSFLPVQKFITHPDIISLIIQVVAA